MKQYKIALATRARTFSFSLFALAIIILCFANWLIFLKKW